MDTDSHPTSTPRAEGDGSQDVEVVLAADLRAGDRVVMANQRRDMSDSGLPSKNRVNKVLREALLAPRALEGEAADYWQVVDDECASTIGRVETALAGFTDAPVGRPKRPEVVAQKLARHEGLQVLSVDDLAGVRVIVGSRFEQDVLADHLADVLNISNPRCWVDRRADPRSGYRALHLLDRSGYVRCEVQIRTTLQHRWAEAFEGLAEVVGRGLRYGEFKAPPGSAVAQIVGSLADLSDAIATAEDADNVLLGVTARRRLSKEPEWTGLLGDMSLGREQYLQAAVSVRCAQGPLVRALESTERAIAGIRGLKEDGVDVLRLGL